MYRPIFCALATLAAVCFVGVSSDAQPAKTKGKAQKNAVHLQHALFDVQLAHKQLSESTFSYGNHKQAALTLMVQAAQQITLGLQAEGAPTNPVPAKRDVKEASKNAKAFPHLHHAVRELEHAKVQLKEAKHDFKGHRKQALHDVDQALQQVHALLKAAKKT